MKRKLNFESLESRRLLAGNVTARYVNHELVIAGDNAANAIQVYAIPGSDGSNRTFQVIGRNFDGNFTPSGTPTLSGTPTMINGRTNPVSIFVPSAKVRIATNGGNDAIFYGRAASVPGANVTLTVGLNIVTGTGQDYLRILNARDENINPTVIRMTQGTASNADLENDVDHVSIDGFHAQRSLNLSTGGGNDIVSIQNFNVTNGLTVINTGWGQDKAQIRFADFDRVFMDMGGSVGTNRENNSDRDELIAHNLRGNSAEVYLGGGDDLTTVSGGVEFVNVKLHGGTGNDELRGSQSSIVGNFIPVSIEILPNVSG